MIRVVRHSCRCACPENRVPIAALLLADRCKVTEMNNQKQHTTLRNRNIDIVAITTAVGSAMAGEETSVSLD